MTFIERVFKSINKYQLLYSATKYVPHFLTDFKRSLINEFFRGILMGSSLKALSQILNDI